MASIQMSPVVGTSGDGGVPIGIFILDMPFYCENHVMIT